MDNIAAYTQPTPADYGDYVEYVSINRGGSGATVTVRNKTGVAVTMTLSLEALRKLANDVLAKVPE